MPDWQSVLELDETRTIVKGSAEALCAAIGRGADLRVGSAFHHNEHIDVTSSSNELIREVMDFRVTYLLDGRWVAGIENLRMPVALPDGFGPRASMSFFLYNQDGHQAVARPFLEPAASDESPTSSDVHPKMPKEHILETWDEGTNAPSQNFIYDFNEFRYLVCDRWRQVLAHDGDGRVESGSIDALADAVGQGHEVKVAIGGLCDDLALTSEQPIDHEVFVHVGACYFYTQTKVFHASANPVIRTRPAIPLGYGSHTWDFGWLVPRTDGHLARWLCDPYTLKFTKSNRRHAMRWFVTG